MSLKNILNIKLSFSLSTILILIFFFIIFFLFINIQIQINDMIVFASGVDLIKDIKNSQYLAIVKGEAMKFEIENDNRFKISYTNENLIYINSNPLFKSVKIEPKGLSFLIKSDGSFEIKSVSDEIYLKKEGSFFEFLFKKTFNYKIKLREDGRIFLEKES